MRRKVIRQANSAYTITLPIGWVRANRLDKNLEVNLVEDGKTLVISNEGSVEVRKARLDISGFKRREIYRHVTALYALGVDEIELVSDSDVSSVIISLLNSLIGYALVSQEGTRYVIRDVAGVGASEVDEVFKRVFQAVILFYSSAIEDIFGDENETQESLRMRDLEVNKLCLYLQRAINKMSYQDSIRGRVLFTYSFELEKLGDNILRLWRSNLEGKFKKSIGLKKAALDSLKCLERSFDNYYRAGAQKGEEAYAFSPFLLTRSIPANAWEIGNASRVI